MTESYAGDVFENVELTAEELEKKRQEARKVYAKAKNFKELVELDVWKECENILKEDLYKNLHYDKQFLHMCWGLKMTIDRIHAWADHADELLKEYGGQV